MCFSFLSKLPRAAAFAIAALLPFVSVQAAPPFLTDQDPFITLDPGVPGNSFVKAIISSGDTIGGFTFQGIPDGIGLAPGAGYGKHRRTVDVFVAHEETTVPFFGSADFQDASVSQLTLDLRTGAVLNARVALPASAGYLRFCSASMAGPAEGFSSYTFFTGEETNDIVDVPDGAPYGPDPAIAPQRQGGYAVALDVASGAFTQIAGMGRLNHENTIALPGWNRLALLTTDDTFNAPSAQLYLYLADNESDVWTDRGSLWAFQVTRTNAGRVKPFDPFNDANDYLDLQPGDNFQGRFIRVPRHIALGQDEVLAPQDVLEQWSNDNNIFQFIRLEDVAYDKNNPRVVYVADTGRSRIVPDPETGRLIRGPSGTVGFADNGRIFKFVFSKKDPRRVVSFSVLADGDAPDTSVFVPMTSPDNIDTSRRSLMVQEDTDEAKVWRQDLGTGAWSVVATVNDPDGESSGIVDASDWFGPGSWILDVQGHGANVAEEQQGDVLRKLESGQVMLMRIPGT